MTSVDSPVTITRPAHRLRGLDSLRGLAIALVVVFHVQLHFPAPGWLGKFALLGYNGVQLFFIVSGITMCYMWSARKDETWETGKFLIRRLCRIAPPFWFAIVFYMLWRQTGYSHLEPADVTDACVTALLLHGFSAHDINLVVPGGWSIADEAGFYLLFPLLVRGFTTVSARLWAAPIVYLACTAGLVASRTFGVDDTTLYYSLLTQLPIFVVAMALYAMLFGRREWPQRQTAAVLTVLGAWATIAWAGKAWGWPTRPGLWAEVLAMLVFTAAVLKRHEWTPFAFLGRLSYSAYLFHFAIIDLLDLWLPRTPGLWNFAVGLICTSLATIAVAWISSRTLEAWSISLGRYLVSRLDASVRRNAVT